MVAAALLALLLLLPSLACADGQPLPVLAPDVPLTSEVLRHGASAVYALAPLVPHAFYEVRISYPGTMPTRFELAFEAACTGRPPPPRRLLDIEKASFQADARGRIPRSMVSGDGDAVLRVVAHNDGVPARAGSAVHYDIVLETLVFTNIPWPALTIAGLLVGLGLAAAAALRVPAVQAGLRAVLRVPASKSH